MLRDLHALAAFHLEGFGDDRNRQDAKFLGDLCHDRCRTCSGTATHPGGDEQHVRALDDFHYAITILHGSLSTDIRIRPSAEALGYIASDLQ